MSTQDGDGVEGRQDYAPARYWTERLRKDFNLRGVGHGQYSEAYNSWIYRQKARAIDKVLPRPAGASRALDIGSGIGWVVDALQQRGWKPDGCDISDLAVERLRERFPASTFVTYAFGSGPLAVESGTYDLVTMLDVSYHVVDDALWAGGVAEIARVLAPGGSAVFLDRFGPTDDDVAAHVRFRSLSRWDEVCGSAGLRRTALEPAYRWLSRPLDEGVLRHVPNRLRGPMDFALEATVPRTPHMRVARFERAA